MDISENETKVESLSTNHMSSERFSEPSLSGLSAKAPPAKKDSVPGTGTQFQFAFSLPRLLLCTRCLDVRFSSFIRCLMPCLRYKKCSQMCLRHKLLLMKETGGKFAHLYKSQKQQVASRYH